MKKRANPHLTIEAECLNCNWHGSAQADKRGTFLHWRCPRCGSKYCGTTFGRREVDEGTVAEGLKGA